jgi:glyoxylase-like metal-dependent hydrolase (beta-lactamase superfamily II)
VRFPLLAFLLAAGLARAADATPYPFSFEEVKLAPGVYGFIEKTGHAVVSGNSVAIVGDDGVVVVDTGHHPRLTRMMIERLRAITPKPVLYVVNTHWHNDHVSGNALYAEAFPHARFIAHAFTARTMDAEIPRYMRDDCREFLRKQSAPLREAAAKGQDAEGRAIPEARMARLRAFVADADAADLDCTEFRYRGADLAFEERLTVRLGGREVQVLYLGRANTAGDAVVYVPDAKVLMTGDILVHPFPFATQSYIGEWAAVLRRLEAMDADVIVPGHGPAMHDKAYLRQVAELMESIDAQVNAAWRDGMTLDELRSHVDLAAMRERFAGGSAFVAANFDAAARSAIEREWQQKRGHLEPEGLPRG